MRLLFVGINPGLWTAATGTPFARPGNRFWPALVTAGILPRIPAYSATLGESDRRLVFDAGIGVTTWSRARRPGPMSSRATSCARARRRSRGGSRYGGPGWSRSWG